MSCHRNEQWEIKVRGAVGLRKDSSPRPTCLSVKQTPACVQRQCRSRSRQLSLHANKTCTHLVQASSWSPGNSFYQRAIQAKVLLLSVLCQT